MESDGKDAFSLAPSNQEGNFSPPLTNKRSQPSRSLDGLLLSLDGGSSIQGNDENPSAVDYRGATIHRAYTILREFHEVRMSFHHLTKYLHPPTLFHAHVW